MQYGCLEPYHVYLGLVDGDNTGLLDDVMQVGSSGGHEDVLFLDRLQLRIRLVEAASCPPLVCIYPSVEFFKAFLAGFAFDPGVD